MLKKIKTQMLTFLIVMIMITVGCTQTEQKKSTNIEVNEDVNESLEDNSNVSNESGNDDSVIEETVIEETNDDNVIVGEIVEFEQNLNIIDDNYRNYYEIFVYSFFDSDGDGIGDINGIREKLDYINDGDDSTSTDLGFNGIWLMPIMPSMTYHKYDVIDYYDIDPAYGTLEDFELLVQECHERDVRLIIDFVFNHTSSRHEWFQAATDYLRTLGEDEEPNLDENPYVDYYYFTKEFDGSDNYHKVSGTNWYYEGVFWGEMPDLNLDNPLVRNEIEAIASYWMELGVDGFRLDAAKEFYSGNKSKNIEVLQWFTDYVTKLNPEAYIVGEVWDSHGAIKEYYTSGITSLFNFPYARYDGQITMMARQLGTSSAKKFGETMMRVQEEFGESNSDFIDAPFVSNHDTTRISAQCLNNLDQMKMAAGLLLMANGSPFVYYGEEIGMNSSGSKDENKRLPMNWSVLDSDGITMKPTNADEVDQDFDPVDVQLRDPLSLLNYYKKAIIIRNEHPEIARGKVTFDETLSSRTVCVISKEYDGQKVTIIYNIDKEGTTIDLTGTDYEGLTLQSYLDVDGSGVSYESGQLVLGKYTIVVLK